MSLILQQQAFCDMSTALILATTPFSHRRVPRSQISRAAYAAVAQQFGMHAEGTSAVVSGLSCDEGTCLSAAEAAGEGHVSSQAAL